MPHPIKTTSFLSPLMLREDVPRQTASDYWAGPHAEIVKRSLPGIVEYVQHHFSATDHGFWPATQSVGTHIPRPGGSTATPRSASRVSPPP